MPSLHIPPPTPQERQKMDELYAENLELSKKINELSNQNTFFSIQIKNFEKLTNSINKDLYQLGMNFQKANEANNSAKIETNQAFNPKQTNLGLEVQSSSKLIPLFTVSNKIKLKNLQMKIGNSIREAERVMKKNLEGTIGPLENASELISQELTLIFVKNAQLNAENKLLKAFQRNKDSFQESYKNKQIVYLRDCINNLYEVEIDEDNESDIFKEDGFLKQFKLSLNLNNEAVNFDSKQNQKSLENTIYRNYSLKKSHKSLKGTKLPQLEKILKQHEKIIDLLKKQSEQKEKMLLSLSKNNQELNENLRKIKKNQDNYRSTELSLKEKLQLELQYLSTEEEKLVSMICKQSAELDEQYILNRESKQRIADRKYQQAKEVKVLEQEVGKCRDQLRQIRAKCRNKQNSSIYRY